MKFLMNKKVTTILNMVTTYPPDVCHAELVSASVIYLQNELYFRS